MTGILSLNLGPPSRFRERMMKMTTAFEGLATAMERNAQRLRQSASGHPSRVQALARSSTAPAAAVRPPVASESAASARAAERKRWETVMLSDGVKGRERIAAAMLASGDDSATTILGNLAKVRTDVERQRAQAVERNTKAASVWDRAIANVYGTGNEQ